MELRNSRVLILGGAGLVGMAVARKVMEKRPAAVVVASLRRTEAEAAARQLADEFAGNDTEVSGAWGDLFTLQDFKDRPRGELSTVELGRIVDDIYGPLTEDVFSRSSLGTLLTEVGPDAIVDCVNTAGALAYRNAFAAVAELREAASRGAADREAVDRLLATLYLPQLIRHAQVTLEGMKRAGTRIYVKVGTVGTGGMGLNIPFTHSEERPSRTLLAKSSLAGAHTLLLYLMARTPDAPAVKEIKPTAAISWKSIGAGPVMRGGKPMLRSDAVGPTSIAEAFADGGAGFTELDATIDGVYLDAGENGLFSLPEFETLTALGLMEFVTPEEIAENVLREIQAHPSGKDVVAALDAATMGPTYRAGVLRAEAIGAMEALEKEQGTESVAYEMLGPPRLSKVLFEGQLLRLMYGSLEVAAGLDPAETSRRARTLVEDDDDLRQRILSIGLPILLPDGETVLRGARIQVIPPGGLEAPHEPTIAAGWIDLRPENWARWRERIAAIREEIAARPTVLQGSGGDHDFGDDMGDIRPGRLAAWIFRSEDQGVRTKR